MAKRFTDSDKWKKPFLRGLKAPYKLLWLYIWDECDHAGFWQVDFEVAKLKIGEKVNIEEASKLFQGKIISVESGELWFIPDFIEFQHPELSESNRAHTKIIALLRKYDLLTEDLKIKEAPYKPLTSPLQGDKDMDKEIVKEKDKEEEKEEAPKLFLIMPWDSEKFLSVWDLWKDYKKKSHKFEYKDIRTEQMALKQLVDLSEGIEKTAIEILNMSIANGWKGMFAVNPNNNGQSRFTTTKPTAQQQAESAMQILFDRHNPGNGETNRD